MYRNVINNTVEQELPRRIPKVTARVTFGFSKRGNYFRVAVTFGWLKNLCTVTYILDKTDTTKEIKSYVSVHVFNYPHKQSS